MISRQKLLEKLPWRGLLGLYEWSSGLVCINMSVDLFMALRTAQPDDWLQIGDQLIGPASSIQPGLFMTLTHETYHALQAATTGYLYDFSSCYFNAVKEMLPFPFDEGKFLHTLDKPPAFTDELNELLGELLEWGPGRVSVLDLVESAATLYQYRTHWKGLTPHGYSQFLEDLNPPNEYRRGYDVGVDILGAGRAFEEVLSATTISLMFARPQDVYMDVLTEMNRLTPDEIRSHLVAAFQHIGREVMDRGHAPLGSSMEVIERTEESELHPIITDIALMLNENASRASPFALLSDPGWMDHQSASDALRPMVFRDAIALPEPLRHMQENVDVFLMLAALVCSAADAQAVGPGFGCVIH